MNQKALFAGGLALVLAAVFLAVRDASGDKATEITPASSRDVAQGAQSTGLRSDGEARFRIRQGTGPKERTIAELTEEMANIINNVEPLTLAQQWLDFVNSLEPGEFEALAADFNANRYNQTNYEEFRILVSAWAKVDPQGAITWADKKTGGIGVRNTILATWAASDLDAAIQWAETAITRVDLGEQRGNYWMVGVITGICQDDPALATSLMVKMPYSEERGRALAVVLPQIERQGPDATREWIDSLPDEKLRAGAREILANGYDRTPLSTKPY